MQPVRDGEHGAVRKRAADGALDEGIRGVVHIAGGLVLGGGVQGDGQRFGWRAKAGVLVLQ